MRSLGLVFVLATALALARTPAHAEPPRENAVRLRFATVAPDGTAWAREMRAMSRDLAAETHGAIDLKWYFSGIAGGEEEVVDRIRRGQLEGVGAGIECTRLAPSLRVLRVPGMFGTRAESLYVMGRLRSRVAAEFERNGFVSLGEGGFGNDIIFSKEPVATLSDLQRGRFAFWDLDDVMRVALPLAGMTRVVPIRIEAARAAFERGEIDGVIAMVTPALAFQWTSIARYYSTLPMAFMPGCLVMSRAAFDALSIEQQQLLRTVGAKFQARINELSQEQDDRLLGGLLEHQGLHRINPSELFRSEFFGAAQKARAQLSGGLVPEELMQTVLRWLADYRAENR